MSPHRSKKRKRTSTAVGDGSSIDKSSGSDRWTPPPPKPRAAPVTAAQGLPRRAKIHHRKSPGTTGRCHGGQRCCVVCGGDGGSGPRARCSMCDGEYHPGCLDPPRAYAPKGGWVCGLCGDSSYLGQGNSQRSLRKGSPTAQKRRQQQPQQQQEVAAEPRARLAGVASSALARLSSLSDGRGGRSREAAASEQRPPGVAGPVASKSREREDAARMTDSVLAWALKSVGGSGEEGRTTTPSHSGGGSTGGSSGAAVYLEATAGNGARESRPLWLSLSSSAAERRGERRKRGTLSRSGSRVFLESVGGDDNDGFSSPLSQEEKEAQEGAVMSDAFDNEGGGGGDDDTSATSTGTNGEAGSSAAVVAPGSDSEEDGEGTRGRKIKRRSLWDKDENTRFLQGVTKYGDAWARIAQRHQDAGVVVVDDSDGDDDKEDADGGDFGGGEPCTDNDGEVYASAPPAGGEGNEQRQSKKQDNGKRQRKSKDKKLAQRRGLKWDEDEHQRFIEGFRRHGSSWAEVARVVGTRSEEIVARYALRWVNDKGGVRHKATFTNSGRWDDDEHERFVEGVKKFGRSFEDVAIVVGTRSGGQCQTHAKAAPAKEQLSRGVSSSMTQDARKKPWGKEEHERFLEAVAKHGSKWAAVAQALGTRNKTQVCNHAVRVLNKDLSPKTPPPTPASPAKRSSGARAEDVVPPRAATPTAAAAAAAAAEAEATSTSARATPTPKTARPPRRQPAKATAATKPGPRATAAAAAAAGDAGGPVNTGKEPPSAVVVENDSGDENDDHDDDGDGDGDGNGDGDGLGAKAAFGGEANKGRDKAEKMKQKKWKKERGTGEESLGRNRLQRDLAWDWREHKRFVEGFKEHGSSWVEVARAVRTRSEEQVARYALRWVDDNGRVRRKTTFTNTGRWDDDEHKRFLEGVKKFGRAFRDVAIVVRTRSLEQVKKHARAEEVKKHAFSGAAKSCRWDKDENERFLEAVAKHGSKWVAVAQAVGTRDRTQVYQHSRRVLNKDLSLKITAPTPTIPAKRRATPARGGGGENAATAPEGESTAEASRAADESENKDEDDSRTDAGKPPALDDEAAEETTTRGEGGGGGDEEERARVASNTRPRPPSDAQESGGGRRSRRAKRRLKRKK
eukprot:g8475.t1